jgi:predicted secreted protein
MDHITFNLSQANKITAVSNSSVTNGYIEFEDNDGNTMRYEIDANNYAVFGPVGSLSELAGPVSQLQFTCYDACDLDTALGTPIDVNLIRTVKAQSTLNNSAALGRDQSFTAQAYLRTNAAGGSGEGQTVTEEPTSQFEFDTDNGQGGVLCRIDATHHLLVYKGGTGASGKGYATILIVNTGNWAISQGTKLVFDNKACGGPDLSPIDATNYLCVYQGDKADGYAVILTVNPATWTISKGTTYEFDEDNCSGPALSQIDSDDYLCAYSGSDGDGFAVILTVNTGATPKTVSKGTPFEFETADAGQIALSNIDNTHHLCAYELASGAGVAVVLAVNTGTTPKTVTKEGGAPFQFEAQQAQMNELIKIDQNHYLCASRCWGAVGKALILTVNTVTWAIGKGATIQYDPDQGEYPCLEWISGNNYLLAYAGELPSESDVGKAIVLTVDTQTDTVSLGTDIVHDDKEGVSPDLSKVDDSHYLCAYEGLFNDGFATILTVGEEILP